MPNSSSKNRIFILGCIIIGIVGLLLIYSILVVTGVVHFKENKLVFTAESNSKRYDGAPLVASKYDLSGDLMPGHEVVAEVTGEITEPGIAQSNVTVRIYDTQGKDVTDEYSIQYASGTLQVFGWHLKLSSNSVTKTYDGQELTSPECMILEGAVVNGHSISMEAIGRITDIGAVENVIKYSIVDNNGNDVSYFYDIVKEEGTLEVTKIPYSVKTGSDTKLYDGTPLTCEECVEFGNLLDGHESKVIYTGKIVGEGTADNTAIVKITDKKTGKDVTHLYEISVQPGELTVVGPPRENEEEIKPDISGEDALDGAVSGSDMNDSDNDAESKKKLEVFRVTASKGGRILFRTQTFGDYNYHGWGKAPAEPDAVALYYTSREMKAKGVGMEFATVESIIDYGYLLPYYADEETVDTSLRNYTVGYMPYDHTAKPITDATETDSERAYRIFVYSEYLALPTDTKTAMLKLLQDAGLDASSMTVLEQVAWVENYVKTSAKYNLKYKEYPEIVDTAIYFLSVSKEGVCRQFATAATVALRALGIPARYTVGFAADVQENISTVVTGDKAHAWVEVYIEGLGWIAIDPTGSDGGSGNGGSGEGDNPGGEDIIPPEGKLQITLLPTAGTKEYDGQPLEGKELLYTIKDNVRLFDGDELVVEMGGSITEPGETESYIISCRAVEIASGADVSYRYDFDISATATLKITRRKVTVYSEDAVKVYDGEPLTCHDYALVYENALLNGYRLHVEFSGSQTERGMSDNLFTATVVDENGAAVTDWEKYYEICPVYGTLRVVHSFLIFKTDSAEKEYDGTPLVPTGGCEYIGGELMEGHTIRSVEITVSRTLPGTVLNVPTVVVVDGAGNDVSYMYAVSEVQLGRVTVSRIRLRVTSESASAVFDPAEPDKKLTCPKYTYEGALLEGHNIEVHISGSIDSVGFCDNQIDYVTVCDNDGRNVGEFYDIETVNGVLSILPPEERKG